LDYFWLFAAIWAGFGALLAVVVLRRLDVSRMSYREAKQMLSAMVASLSSRIRQNEALTKELCEQVEMLNANQTRLTTEAQTADRERLLGYMQDWIANVGRFIDKVDGLQKNVKRVEEEHQQLRAHVALLTGVQQTHGIVPPAPVGVVTEDTLAKLTETEKQVLELLASGPKPGTEIGPLIGKSREHTARLMKSLFEQGFVDRETGRQPYEYRLNDKVSNVIGRAVRPSATSPEGLEPPQLDSTANARRIRTGA